MTVGRAAVASLVAVELLSAACRREGQRACPTVDAAPASAPAIASSAPQVRQPRRGDPTTNDWDAESNCMPFGETFASSSEEFQGLAAWGDDLLVAKGDSGRAARS